MRAVKNNFGWMSHPTLLVSVVSLCLFFGALGSSLARPLPPPTKIPPVPHVKAAELLAPTPDCAAVPCLALTFDDGPDSTATPMILDVLARNQVKATFFVVGSHVAGREPILQREYREGHEIGNHTWNHPDLSTLSPEGVVDQLQRTQATIAGAGVPAPRLLRPPYGVVDPMVASHNNLTVVRWNVDPEDWKQRDPQKVFEHIVTHARPGAIILLHDLYPTTAPAVDMAVQTLKPQYQFVTASQLLDLSPGDQGQYFGR
jgi:peptidoglycan/xylan/chitin deacetylase (PgdA/CDA1 family)